MADSWTTTVATRTYVQVLYCITSTSILHIIHPKYIVVLACNTRCPRMAFTWSSRGPGVVLTWDVHGLREELTWSTHGYVKLPLDNNAVSTF